LPTAAPAQPSTPSGKAARKPEAGSPSRESKRESVKTT
jgi:hypothetical protein